MFKLMTCIFQMQYTLMTLLSLAHFWKGLGECRVTQQQRDTIDSLAVEVLAWQMLYVHIVFLYWAARFTKQRNKGSICEHTKSIVTRMTFKYTRNNRTHTVPILQYLSNQGPPSSIVLPFTIPHSFQWHLKRRWLCRPWQYREKSAM